MVLGDFLDKYGLPRPELVRSDNALYSRHFRVMEMYDCIVTDPPYGIRCARRGFVFCSVITVGSALATACEEIPSSLPAWSFFVAFPSRIESSPTLGVPGISRRGYYTWVEWFERHFSNQQ